MVTFSKASRPSTPSHRWSRILDVFTPVGKRLRGHSPRYLHAIVSTNTAGKLSVAIQNEDEEEDIIIVTTLNEIPFCCHADLLTMNHEQLLIVGRTLNAKLPSALHIDLERTDVFIRNSIELIVGLKQFVPDAPAKAPYNHPRFADRSPYSPTSPVSPLSRLGRSQVSYMKSPNNGHCLAVLKEETEAGLKAQLCREDMTDAQPRAKRKRVDSMTGPFISNKRITRSQSTRAHPVPSAIAHTRVLRSYSQKLPSFHETSLLNDRRSFKTSTPKQIRKQALTHCTALDDPLISNIAPESPSAEVEYHASERDGSCFSDDLDMTFGIQGMTMFGHSSSLDISTD